MTGEQDAAGSSLLAGAPPAGAVDIDALIAEAMAGRSPAELQGLLRSLLAAGSLAGGPARPPGPCVAARAAPI